MYTLSARESERAISLAEFRRHCTRLEMITDVEVVVGSGADRRADIAQDGSHLPKCRSNNSRDRSAPSSVTTTDFALLFGSEI